MKVLKIILSTLFTIIFILSLGFNIILLSSSTNILFIKDSVAARNKLYFNAGLHFSTETEIKNIKHFHANMYDFVNNTNDEVYCEYKLNEETNLFYHDCLMISTKYNDNHELIRTSYYPSDGYEYSKEGNTLTKKDYSNQKLYSHISSIPGRMNELMAFYLGFDPDLYTNQDTKTPENERTLMTYKTIFEFDFKNLGFNKTINFYYIIGNNASKAFAQFQFDSNDKLIRVHTNNPDKLLIQNPEYYLHVNYAVSIDYEYVARPEIPEFVGNI